MSNVVVDIAHTLYYLFVIRSSRYNSHVGVHISQTWEYIYVTRGSAYMY